MPNPEASHIMKVEMEECEGRKRFTLWLSHANLDHLVARCPEIGCLIGRTRKGLRFRLFPGHQMPEAFRLMGDRDGYFAKIGVPPSPKDAARDEKERLRSAIRNYGKIPIRKPTQDNPVRLGFVEIQFEE